MNTRVDHDGNLYFNAQGKGLYVVGQNGTASTVCSDFPGRTPYMVIETGAVLYLGEASTGLYKCSEGKSEQIEADANYFGKFANGDWFFTTNDSSRSVMLFDAVTKEIDSKPWMATKVNNDNGTYPSIEATPLANAYHNIYLGDAECTDTPEQGTFACTGDINIYKVVTREGKTIAVTDRDVYELYPSPKRLFALSDPYLVDVYKNILVIVTKSLVGVYSKNGDNQYEYKLKTVDLSSGSEELKLSLATEPKELVVVGEKALVSTVDGLTIFDLVTGEKTSSDEVVTELEPYLVE